jgi:hypothetical protein
MSSQSETERAVARGIDREKRADAAGNGVGVVVFLLIAALVIYLGIHFNWGGWAGLWAVIAGGIAGAIVSTRTKRSVLDA